MQLPCPQCGALLSCNPGPNCWCNQLPHTHPIPHDATTSCLCPTCLTTKLKRTPAP
jgi:ribosomal protein L34E